jgi:hypothetical protein
MSNATKFYDYVSDVWYEVDLELRRDREGIPSTLWMTILSIFQNKADAFGIERKSVGLPEEDADSLFIRLEGHRPE